MASSLAFRRAANVSSPLLMKLIDVGSLRTLAAAPSMVRSFNTNAQMTTYGEGDRSVDVERRPESGVFRRRDSFPSFFSDVLTPFSPTRSVSQLLNLMDRVMEDPFLAARELGPAAVSRRGWDVREGEKALYIKMDMPGLDKENVKVTVEQNTLVIKGEGVKESEEEEHGRRYSSRLDLPPNLYKIEEVKAEMKNGVLKVIVPKVEEEERKDAFQVKVD
ncbi:small heat shock protein, chloroplastic-like [Coffea arabica]|uniref:Small heat shock protein, chloroplastic-like n=1 Tax=Coffea arabica TaxID=13443 RepID=A0ABM4VF11_COFAR|nr:small heat shock protein, chloroplastic-like [Coffea arabica]